MTVLEQQQRDTAQVLDAHLFTRGERMPGRRCHHERFVVERLCDEAVETDRQGQHPHIDVTGMQAFEHGRGLVLIEHELQARQGFVQARGDPGQEVGADGRQKGDAQTAGERVSVGASDLHHLVARLDDAPCARHDLCASRCQQRLPGLTLDEHDAEVLLELAQLRRQGRLADEAALGGLAEVPGIGDGDEIAQVLEFDVGHETPCLGDPYRLSIEIIASIDWRVEARGPTLRSAFFPMDPQEPRS